ncbi:hypothetical protein IDM40_19940 [Nocardiopsis sp. HNM0947]|uniref:Uncharacterized protein n=1 Tax=Nocardiopsis coralli TaxID=2772213 RepID=A0ABR9PAS7_9ACTN|nr:hypothetical protein [Nocardiopsis coralli]MBE3000946.1 hypothetical protein [Nocardiopsis coralli]
MAVEKLSVSLEPETVARARRAAEREGVPLSRWLDRVARKAADLEEARLVLEEHFAERGQPTEAAETASRAAAVETGVGQPVPWEDAQANQAVLARLDEDETGET